MKLKNKLYISFCIMVILPVLLSGLALGGLYCVQKESIERFDTIIDSVKLLPFLFLTYLAMEYIHL